MQAKDDPSLLDHLLSLMPEAQARFVYLCAQHPDAVKLLIEDEGTSYDWEWSGGACRSCKTEWSVDEVNAEHHTPECKYVQALRVLSHWKLARVEAAQKRWEELVLWEEHFADATTHELEWEERNADRYGRVPPPPPEDY